MVVGVHCGPIGFGQECHMSASAVCRLEWVSEKVCKWERPDGLSGVVCIDTKDDYDDAGAQDVASCLLITLYLLGHLKFTTNQWKVHIILFYWRDN